MQKLLKSQQQPPQPQQQLAPAPVAETIDAEGEVMDDETLLSEFDKLADAYSSKDDYQSVLTDDRKMATKIDSVLQFKERVRNLLDKNEVSKLDSLFKLDDISSRNIKRTKELFNLQSGLAQFALSSSLRTISHKQIHSLTVSYPEIL